VQRHREYAQRLQASEGGHAQLVKITCLQSLRLVRELQTLLHNLQTYPNQSVRAPEVKGCEPTRESEGNVEVEHSGLYVELLSGVLELRSSFSMAFSFPSNVQLVITVAQHWQILKMILGARTTINTDILCQVVPVKRLDASR